MSMAKEDARVIICALVHDGIDARALTPKAREEIRSAFDVVLRLSCSKIGADHGA